MFKTHFGVKEDFGSQKSFVTDFNFEFLPGDGVEAFVMFDPFCRVHLVFVELFGDIRTNVAVTLLEIIYLLQ